MSADEQIYIFRFLFYTEQNAKLRSLGHALFQKNCINLEIKMSLTCFPLKNKSSLLPVDYRAQEENLNQFSVLARRKTSSP